jgi:tetratricopeptide (TPR) repeat protein
MQSIIDSKNVLELLPDDFESFQILGSAYYFIGSEKAAKGDIKEAIIDFSKSIKYCNSVPSVYLSRAKAYQHIGVI